MYWYIEVNLLLLNLLILEMFFVLVVCLNGCEYDNKLVIFIFVSFILIENIFDINKFNDNKFILMY